MHQRLWLRLATMALIGVIVNARSALCAYRTGDDVLQAYSSAISALKTIRLTATKNAYEQGGAFDSETWMNVESVEFVSVGEQWRYRLRQRGNTWHGGQFYPFAIDRERARDERGNVYEVWRRLRPDEVLSEHEALGFIIPADTEDSMVGVVLEDESKERKLEPFLHEITRPLYGYLPSDNTRWLPQLMKNAGVVLADEPVSIDGHTTLVLTSHGLFGTYVLYLDPEHGYLPRRITCDKEGDARFGPKEQPMNSLKAHGRPDHRKPNSPLRKLHYEVTDISISSVGGRHFVDGFETVTIFTYLDGAMFQLREVVSITNVSMEPSEAEVALTLDIPDGARVQIANAPAIEAEWRDGQIVKTYDQTAVETLGDVRFRPAERPILRRWLVIATIGFLALLIGLLLYQRLRVTRSPPSP